jgi:uncharacterized repeat protein (TIGR03803 family)
VVTDGAYPFDSLIQGTDGNFFGTTRNGGHGGMLGGGTVFRITPAGALTTVHRFRTDEGVDPYSALVQGKDGNLYGTLSAGGPYSNRGVAAGTAVRVTAQGNVKRLYSFCSQTNCTDG